MEITNIVLKGRLSHKCQLNNLIFHNANVESMRYQVSQPEQLVIRFRDGYTMLLFKSGKFRVMGKMTDWSVLPVIYTVLGEISNDVPDVDIQTMTVVYRYDYQVNLLKLADIMGCMLDCESFPALAIRKFKPVHVNVFSSGKVIMCGIRTVDAAESIKAELDPVVIQAKI